MAKKRIQVQLQGTDIVKSIVWFVGTENYQILNTIKENLGVRQDVQIGIFDSEGCAVVLSDALPNDTHYIIKFHHDDSRQRSKGYHNSDPRGMVHHHSIGQRPMQGQMWDHHLMEPSSVQMSDNSVMVSNQMQVNSHFSPSYPMAISHNSAIHTHEMSGSYSQQQNSVNHSHAGLIYHQPMARVAYGPDSYPNPVMVNTCYPQSNHDTLFEQSQFRPHAELIQNEPNEHLEVEQSEINQTYGRSQQLWNSLTLDKQISDEHENPDHIPGQRRTQQRSNSQLKSQLIEDKINQSAQGLQLSQNSLGFNESMAQQHTVLLPNNHHVNHNQYYDVSFSNPISNAHTNQMTVQNQLPQGHKGATPATNMNEGSSAENRRVPYHSAHNLNQSHGQSSSTDFRSRLQGSSGVQPQMVHLMPPVQHQMYHGKRQHSAQNSYQDMSPKSFDEVGMQRNSRRHNSAMHSSFAVSQVSHQNLTLPNDKAMHNVSASKQQTISGQTNSANKPIISGESAAMQTIKNSTSNNSQPTIGKLQDQINSAKRDFYSNSGTDESMTNNQRAQQVPRSNQQPVDIVRQNLLDMAMKERGSDDNQFVIEQANSSSTNQHEFVQPVMQPNMRNVYYIQEGQGPNDGVMMQIMLQPYPNHHIHQFNPNQMPQAPPMQPNLQYPHPNQHLDTIFNSPGMVSSSNGQSSPLAQQMNMQGLQFGNNSSRLKQMINRRGANMPHGQLQDGTVRVLNDRMQTTHQQVPLQQNQQVGRPVGCKTLDSKQLMQYQQRLFASSSALDYSPQSRIEQNLSQTPQQEPHQNPNVVEELKEPVRPPNENFGSISNVNAQEQSLFVDSEDKSILENNKPKQAVDVSGKKEEANKERDLNLQNLDQKPLEKGENETEK